MVTLSKYSGSFTTNARIFRPAKMNSIAATHASHSAFPYTMSVHANETVSESSNMSISTLDDYSAILDHDNDTLLVQHDCCLPDNNTLTEYESNCLRENIMHMQAISPNKIASDFDTLDNCKDFKTLCSYTCACTALL